MERWRHGDFCSKQHKEDFAAEVQRLMAERLSELRKQGKEETSETPGDDTVVAVTGATDPELAQAPAEPPAPEMQAFLPSQVQPMAAPPAVPANEAPPPRPGRTDWKYLAKVADLEALPITLQPGISRLYRQLELENLWVDARFLRAAARAVFVPEPFRVMARGGALPKGEMSPPESFAGQSWATAPEPAPIPRVTWVDQTGNRWVYSVAQTSVSVPGIGVVLEEYPLSAPWNDWPVEEEPVTSTWRPGRPPVDPVVAPPTASGASPAPPPSEPPMGGAIRPSSMPPVAPATTGRSGQTMPAGPSGAEARVAPAGPSQPPSQAKGQGRPAGPVLTAPSSGQAAGQAPPRAVSGPAGPGATPRAEILGGPGGSIARSPDAAVRGAGGARKGANAWMPMVPPVFRALIDVAHDMAPAALPFRMLLVPVKEMSVRPGASHAASRRCEVRARLAPFECDLSALAAGAAQETPACLMTPPSSSLWRKRLAGLPRLALRLEKPGLPTMPRHLPVVLPLLDRWSGPAPEPVLSLGELGRW